MRESIADRQSEAREMPSAGSRRASPVAIGRTLQAPRSNGAHLIVPPLEAAAELAAENVRTRHAAHYDVQGCSLGELSDRARRQLAAAAYDYTRAYRDADQPDESAPLFLAGHQPEIFHPGVWFKNFVLGELARRHRGVAINLVVDSDTIKASSLRVPGGSVAEPRVESVLLDHPSAEIPFEERTIADQALFDSFAERVAKRLAPLVRDPLISEYWPLAVACSRRTRNFGECLAQSRHQLEGRWGAATLEIPQSLVCSLEAFHWFTAHLLVQLPRLREIYNGALAEYRVRHHVRSSAHPAPELAIDGPWLEAPYWIWNVDNPRRRRLFVRQRGAELLLSDREQLEVALSLSPDGDAGRAVEQLAALPDRGIRLRSRALLTTLAARLLFGDLFIHGIGGAKYDRLTDAIMERFFGLQPPAYLVVSGTLHLPTEHPGVTEADARRVDRELRDLEFHPELFLGNVANGDASDVAASAESANGDSQSAHWVRLKQHWIAAPFTAAEARTRCREIRRANAELQPWVAPRRAELKTRAKFLRRALRAEMVLSSREYGFCLYPEKTLRGFLLEFPADTP